MAKLEKAGYSLDYLISINRVMGREYAINSFTAFCLFDIILDDGKTAMPPELLTLLGSQ